MFCCLYITVEFYPKKVIIPLNSQFSILNFKLSFLNFKLSILNLFKRKKQ